MVDVLEFASFFSGGFKLVDYEKYFKYTDTHSTLHEKPLLPTETIHVENVENSEFVKAKKWKIGSLLPRSWRTTRHDTPKNYPDTSVTILTLQDMSYDVTED